MLSASSLLRYSIHVVFFHTNGDGANGKILLRGLSDTHRNHRRDLWNLLKRQGGCHDHASVEKKERGERKVCVCSGDDVDGCEQ